MARTPPFLGSTIVCSCSLFKKRRDYHFRRPFSLVRFFLDEQKEMNILKRKEDLPYETPLAPNRPSSFTKTGKGVIWHIRYVFDN